MSEDEEEEEEEEDISLPAENNIKNIHELAASLANMKAFAVSNGCHDFPENCMDMEEKVETEFFKLHQTCKQTALLDFFKHNTGDKNVTAKMTLSEI